MLCPPVTHLIGGATAAAIAACGDWEGSAPPASSLCSMLLTLMLCFVVCSDRFGPISLRFPSAPQLRCYPRSSPCVLSASRPTDRMSKRGHSSAVAAAASSSLAPAVTGAPDASKRFRHFHAAKPSAESKPSANGEEEQKQIVTPRLSSSPIGLLHRHALESILGFCDVSGLSRALQTSKEWSAAVHSMKPIDARLEPDDWNSAKLSAWLDSSSLVRHLSDIASDSYWNRVSPTILGQLAQRAVNVSVMHCRVNLPVLPASLILPPRLRVVQLLWDKSNSDAQINALFVTLSDLGRLETLTLQSAQDWFEFESVDFALLQPPALRSFTLGASLKGANLLTNKQLDEFRSPFWANLDKLALPRLDNHAHRYFFRSPHSLRVKELAPYGVFSPEDSAALASLGGTLTKLHLKFCSDVGFFPHMRCLTSCSA